MIVPTMLEQVERFNVDLVGIKPPNNPMLLSIDRMDFRLGHLDEELAEITEGYADGNLEDVTDGLLDLIYVALGTLIEMGIPPGPAFEEVHLANMNRIRGANSTRTGSLGFDAVKPDGWIPPDLQPYLTVARDELVTLAVGKSLGITLDTPGSSDKPKILVMGHARHGKDTVAEMIAEERCLSFTSSSKFCAKKIMWPLLHTYYDNVQACFDDRGNNRVKWFDAITDFNRPDPSALGKAIFAEHDIYCGIRSRREFNALKNSGLFDVSVWVDRSDHISPEGKDSCTVEPWMADFMIDNNGTLADLEFNVQQFVENNL